jgi:hypothetical protein
MPTLDDLNTRSLAISSGLDGVFEQPRVAETQPLNGLYRVIALHEAPMAAVLAAPPDVCLGFYGPSAAVAESAR